MTTPDERKRAVDRLLAAPIGTNALSYDFLLSERAELLATVERMREELDVAAVHLQIAGRWLREAGDDGQRTKELLRASNRARRDALTTGEEK